MTGTLINKVIIKNVEKEVLLSAVKPCPADYDSQLSYLSDLYSCWKSQKDINTVGRLHRLMKISVTEQAVRNAVEGMTKKTCFNVFEAAVRVMDYENYMSAICKYYPSMIAFAERAKNYGKIDKTDFLEADGAEDIYQSIISGKEVSEEDLIKRYGDKGREIVEGIVATETVYKDKDGLLKVCADDGFVYTGVGVTQKLIAHNNKKHVPENAGSRKNAIWFRSVCLSEDDANEVTRKQDELFAWIDSLKKVPAGVTMTYNSFSRQID